MMPDEEIVVRLLTQDDFDDVVRIDREHFGIERADYFARRFSRALDGSNRLVVSLVAEQAGQVAGFIMGELHLGEYGTPQDIASVDSIGVDPRYQHRGVGSALMEEFVRNARIAGVGRLYTRVAWNDLALIRFFDSLGFAPSRMINLELDISSP